MNSLVYRLLARLAFLHANETDVVQPPSTGELLDWVRRRIAADPGFVDPVPDLQSLERTLRELAFIGIVQGVEEPERRERADQWRWRVSTGQPPDWGAAREMGGGEGDGNDRPPPERPPGGGGGDGGGAGLAQILAHRFLFSLDEPLQNVLVARAFGLPPEALEETAP